MNKAIVNGFSDGIHVEGFPILTAVASYDTDEGGTIFILAN